MSAPIAPPEGFAIGHWTDPVGVTGCTVVIAAGGQPGGVDVRGGGPGTRETDVIGPLAGAGGGDRRDPAHRRQRLRPRGRRRGGALAARRHGRGYPTPAGLVPIVPAAVIYDLAEGDPAARPDADAGYEACEAAAAGVPERGRRRRGHGAAVGKILGRESRGARRGRLRGGAQRSR